MVFVPSPANTIECNPTMYYNNANCDLYIGTGAGKKLLHDIGQAQHSVKIMSPFVNPDLTADLIALQERGVAIRLITSDDLETHGERSRDHIRQLLRQQVHVDGSGQTEEPEDSPYPVLVGPIVRRGAGCICQVFHVDG